MENNNYSTFNSRVDFENDNNPIEWMEIKDINNDNQVLLRIPYSPLIKIKNFTNAIHKNLILRPGSKEECIVKSIQNLHNNVEICFSQPFLEMIKLNKNRLTELNINCDNIKRHFSQLYFLNNYLSRFGFGNVDANTYNINMENKFILTSQESS